MYFETYKKFGAPFFCFSKINLEKAFRGLSSHVLEGLLRKYELDFRICGYDETLEEFKALIDSTRKAQ